MPGEDLSYRVGFADGLSMCLAIARRRRRNGTIVRELEGRFLGLAASRGTKILEEIGE